jgi:hypothetical protein
MDFQQAWQHVRHAETPYEARACFSFAEFEELEEAWYTANDYVSFEVSAYTIGGRNPENTGAVNLS